MKTRYEMLMEVKKVLSFIHYEKILSTSDGLYVRILKMFG